MIGLNVTDPAEWETLPGEVTHLRIWDVGAHWGAIHTAPGVYEWAHLDRLVTLAGNRHLTYVIGGCPRWAAKYPDQPHYAPWLGPGSNSMPYDLDLVNEFAWQLANRYTGRIHAYEIWNEPQLADFLYPYTDAECNALAQATKRVRATVMSLDPDALILAASVLPRESSGGMKRARRYLDALERKGWPVDAFTTHLYPEAGYWGPRWASMLDDVDATIRAYRPPTTRLWVTETTFGLLGPELTDEDAVGKAVAKAFDAAGGKFIHWYAWDRPDLGGMRIDAYSAGWAAIVRGGR